LVKDNGISKYIKQKRPGFIARAFIISDSNELIT